MALVKRRLFWQVYFSYLLIILFSLVTVAWFASSALKRTLLEQTASDLGARARLVEHEILRLLMAGSFDTIQDLCVELHGKTDTRLTVVLPSGEVVGDSRENPAAMDNHAARPEIQAALAGKTGKATRYSYTLHQNMMYVAVPLSKNQNTVGILRVSLPIMHINETIYAGYLRIALGGLVTVLIAGLVGLFVVRRISRPLEAMRLGAERYAAGDLTHKLALPPSRELADLAAAMNLMAARLHERLETVINQRNEQEAMLASMVEGVLAIDGAERIISLNRTAETLLGVTTAEAVGRLVHEVLRNSELITLVENVLTSDGPIEEEIIIHERERRYLQIHGSPLRDAAGRRIGGLIVINDVTRLRRLEQVRQDFVANVSHEMKTPVTSIKGFVETLRDGAVNDPETAQRFLEIIARQAERLNSIFEDLLTLSRLEQETDRAQITRGEVRVRQVLAEAIQVCEFAAQEKKVRLALSCPDDLVIAANGPLVEQAVINLIDNAVKYSEPESAVEIGGELRSDEIVITVKDTGSGIEEIHLPRLFERFYRVDRARSRKLGGTGLGLAIVKHIAQAHGGRVSVQSSPGVGSVFTIHLPKG